MAAHAMPRMCLGVPVDHRLEPLLSATLEEADPFTSPGSHAQVIENYGQNLQEGGEDIRNREIQFAKWLALPATKGGVVIVLLQPPRYQRYFEEHRDTVKDCDTLKAVDEVCRTITGQGLEAISCFDAFPFHKTPVKENLDENEAALDEAYDVLLQMIQQKQPDIVYCCYRSPHRSKYKMFQSNGIGRKRDYPVSLNGRHYRCVNGFHPGYALSYHEDKCALRTLFMLETAQAFRRVNGTWKEESWMKSVRDRGAGIYKECEKDEKEQPGWTRHDFQRDRFLSRMNMITDILQGLQSGQYVSMTNEDLYEFLLNNDYNFLLSDCLLLLEKISNFEAYGGIRLDEKGLTRVRQNEERDVRDLRRSVEKRCTEFAIALSNVGEVSLPSNGANSQLTRGAMARSHVNHELHDNLRHSLMELVRLIDNARGPRDINKDQLVQGFQTAAGLFERALGQHIASKQTSTSEDVLSHQLDRMGLHNNSPPSTQSEAIGRSQPSSTPAQSPGHQPSASRVSNSTGRPAAGTRPAQTLTSSQSSPRAFANPEYLQPRSGPSHAPQAPGVPSNYPQSPPFTPPQQPAGVMSPSSRASPPPAAPQFGLLSPTVSPSAAPVTPTRSRYTSACRSCKQTGHTTPWCPKSQCYRCKNYGHMTFNCSTPPATPSRQR